MAALLEFAELVRSFGGLRAVDGASFEVEAGSITGLIGPNGAGKTTVFNCATGTLRPDSGRIVFEGRRLDRSRPYHIARAGLVRTFQTPRPLTPQFRTIEVFLNDLRAALWQLRTARLNLHRPCRSILALPFLSVIL